MKWKAPTYLTRLPILAFLLLVAFAIVPRTPVAEAAPPNDNFVAATPIPATPFALPYTNVIPTAGWGVEPGEPLPAIPCDGAFNVQGTAWYTLTPTLSGSYDFDTFGSSFDTVISVYDGGPFPSLTLLACNNDAYHFPQANRTLKVTSRQSSIGVDLIAGTAYYIQVAGNQGAGNLASDVLVFHALLSYFAAPAGGPCQQDHAADTNENGYSDSDDATTKPPACGSYPVMGGFGMDPTVIGAPVGCYTDPLMARTDINLDGSINGLDLGLLAANFGKNWMATGPSSSIAESDFNGDYSVNGLDLGELAARFTMTIPGNCSGGVCSLATLLITAIPGGGCATATRTLNADGSDTVTFFWDRVPPGPHMLNLTAPGCPGVSQPVATPSGTAAMLLPAPPAPGCVAQFDVTALWP